MQIILYQYRGGSAPAKALAEVITDTTQQNYILQKDLPAEHLEALVWALPQALGEAERYHLLQSVLPYVRQGGIALYLQREDAMPIRRIVADLDGCLVAEELLLKLSQGEPFAKDLANATQEAMQGKVPFVEDFVRRIAYLRGRRVQELEDIAYTMPLAPGLDLLVYFVEGEDIRLDIASSNLVPYVHHLSQRINAHEYIATMPSMDENEILDGGLLEPIVGGQEKRNFALANPYDRYPAEATLSVGDGANDLPMLSATGHALLYTSTWEDSLNIGHIVADLYFRYTPKRGTHS